MNTSGQIWLIAAIWAVFSLACFAQDDECKDRDFCNCWESYCSNKWMKEWCPRLCGECTVTTQNKGWSKCTKTCGNGTRHKEECDKNGKCEFVFEPCANTKCPEASCLWPQQRRHGVPHACCAGEVMPFKSRCGQPFLRSRVLSVGGESAKMKEWPWMVAIAMTGGRFCAAVVIGKDYLLSAAHCFADTPDRLYDTSRWNLYSGLLRLRERSKATKLRIKKVTVHPKYQFPVNDVAIVELKNSLKFSSTIQPICLPGGEITPQDGTCYVTGWGISEHSGKGTTDHLQKAPLQNLDRKICRKAYNYENQPKHTKSYLSADEGFLCAGSLHMNVDSCGGDSGGPLVCQRCSWCTWYLAGIVSFGSLECGVIGTPGVYTEVRAHKDWIHQVTGISHSSRTCSRKVGY